MKLKTQIRKTKTQVGVALATIDNSVVGSVTTGPGDVSTFTATNSEGTDLGTFPTRSGATQALWRHVNGKAKSKRGGDQRSGITAVADAVADAVVVTYMTRAEAATELGVSKSTLARRIKSGAVTETKQGISL